MTDGQGYRIVLKPEILVAEYEEYGTTQRWAESLRELRCAFRAFQPTKYRGMSRAPLWPDPSLDKSTNDAIMEFNHVVPTNIAAGRRYREILGESCEDLDFDPGFDRVLLPSIDDAREVLSLTDDPSRWEIIRVTRMPGTETKPTLGYDVGCWGGDFSMIADVCVIPRWHPPVPEDFAVVREVLTSLNDYMLFDSIQEAEAYRQFYESKEWAETGEFEIIRIDSAK